MPERQSVKGPKVHKAHGGGLAAKGVEARLAVVLQCKYTVLQCIILALILLKVVRKPAYIGIAYKTSSPVYL
jgi:hypothetical protein